MTPTEKIAVGVISFLKNGKTKIYTSSCEVMWSTYKWGGRTMTDRTQTRDNAYRWGMLMWFNQLLLDRGTITEAEFRQMRLKIEDSVKRAKDRRC